MRAMLLGFQARRLVKYLKNGDFQVLENPKDVEELNFELNQLEPSIIICFGSPLILPASVLNRFRCVNIHASMLPWCRGPAPHLWTALEGVPFGVSIHEMAEKVDRGPTIVQRPVRIELGEHTLGTLFEVLLSEGARLFGDHADNILSAAYDAIPQPPGGSHHSFRAQSAFQDLLDAGIDRPMTLLVEDIKARMGAAWVQTLPRYSQSN